MEKWYIYILQLKDGTYYTGITNNIEKRMATHANKSGSKYVRSRLPLKIVYLEETIGRSAASKIEAKIKKLTKTQKQELINKYQENLNVRNV